MNLTFLSQTFSLPRLQYAGIPLHHTCNEDPATRTESDSASRWYTKSTFSLLTVSPKNVTSGLRWPPHLLQEGTWKFCTCSSVKKTSPSGATPCASALHVGFKASKSSCNSARGICSPQLRHNTLHDEDVTYDFENCLDQWFLTGGTCTMNGTQKHSRWYGHLLRILSPSMPLSTCKNNAPSQADASCRAISDI